MASESVLLELSIEMLTREEDCLLCVEFDHFEKWSKRTIKDTILKEIANDLVKQIKETEELIKKRDILLFFLKKIRKINSPKKESTIPV